MLKKIAICIELPCNQHHFTTHFDAKKRVICIKLQHITPHIAPKINKIMNQICLFSPSYYIEERAWKC